MNASMIVRTSTFAGIAFCACAAMLWVLLSTGAAWRLATDMPNHRSLHERPTPRVGGWGVVPVVVVEMAVAAPSLWVVAVCALMLAAISQIDDRRGLPARVRFAAHVAAAAWLLIAYPVGLVWWITIGLAVLLIWLTNLYNFMDGADGLAGGMALFGFGGYTLAALMSAHPSVPLACACAAVAGASGGFLLFNFHPARVFLGDAGSIPLGFLSGALGYCGWRAGVWPAWFPVLTFLPFIADASVTLVRRLLRGEKFWHAHREHHYQRMVRSGIGHARTALLWYAVMAVGAIIAVGALGASSIVQWGAIAAWCAVLMAMGAAVDVCWRRSQANVSGQVGR